MLNSYKKIVLCAFGVGLISVSCQKETEVEELMTTPSAVESVQMSNLPGAEKIQIFDLEDFALEALPEIGHNTRNSFASAIEETPCGPTEFVSVQNYHFGQLAKSLLSAFDVASANFLFNRYMLMNQLYAYYDNDAQYFGEHGEYTNFMVKRQRELEKFFDMPNEIRVNGQHTATLNDREKLADLWLIIGKDVKSREDAYAIADTYLFYNSLASQLPDNPYFALDGFATGGNLIVIGDGIVQMLSETGIEEDIVWTGILAHEWAHQIQFNNFETWYPDGAADNLPEATRYTELEADFIAAYFMTHKRGATYNWKRVEQFFELYFNIGDCGFDYEGHHGTPNQRLEAAKLGYELANDAQKQGHILTEQQLHEIFVSEVIDAVVGTQEQEMIAL